MCKRVKRPARPCLGNPPAGLRGLPQGGIHSFDLTFTFTPTNGTPMSETDVGEGGSALEHRHLHHPDADGVQWA